MKKGIMLLLFLSLITAACSEKTVDLEGAAVNYEDLKTKIGEKEDEMKRIEDDIADAKGELNDVSEKLQSQKAQYDELIELSNNHEKLKKETTEFEGKIKQLQSDIKSAKEELAKLEGDVVKAAGGPIKLGAGYFYFGEDIDPGRYKITAQKGHRGNVFISRDNISYVGETFGKGSGSIEDFVFEAITGDEIEATIPVLLYPVE